MSPAPESKQLLMVFWAIAIVSTVCMGGMAVFLVQHQRKRNEEGEAAPRRQKKSVHANILLSRQRVDQTDSITNGDDEEGTEIFADSALEAKWQTHSYNTCVKSGAFKLFMVTILLATYRTLRNWLSESAHCMGYSQQSVFAWPPPLVESLEYLGMAAMLCATWVLFSSESPSSNGYWACIAIYSVYIPASMLPPFQWACTDIMHNEECVKSTYWYIMEAVHFVDCSLSGVTAILMLMTWVLLQPWLLPHLDHMALMCIWILHIFVWTIAYKEATYLDFFDAWDIIMRLLVLCVTLLVSYLKKHYLQIKGRLKFIAERHAREATEKIFQVFEYMVPTHVILPMLEGHAIADPIDRVTIMFVLITGFDDVTQHFSPEEVLRFLNRIFTRMDDICERHHVTKIETVGEEYVAAVGVSPTEVQEYKVKGHSESLGRLFRAGNEILQLQLQDSLWQIRSGPEPLQVKLKIGVHTGPIVAGVIGKKLPRYRLFGDTINTAARMMQKGIEGRMQFGEATFMHVPSFVGVTERGEVEMKGKGKVKAWLLERIIDESYTMQAMPSNADAMHATATNSCRATASKRVRMVRQNTLVNTLLRQDEDDVEDSTSEALRRAQSFRLEHKDDNLFDSVLGIFAGDEDESSSRTFWTKTSNLLSLGLKSGFTPEMEAKWYEWHYRNTFHKKFDRRVTRHLQLLLGFTVVEFTLFLAIGEKDTAEPPSVGWRSFIFFVCRGLSVLAAYAWRYVSVTHKEWLATSAFLVQLGVLCTTWLIMILNFFAYDMLTFHDCLHKCVRADHGEKIERTFRDQIFAPIYVLFYYLTSRHYLLRFWPSLSFVPLSCFLMHMAGSGVLSDGALFFSASGQIMFIIICCLSPLLAWEEEHSSRTRFRANHAVQETQERTESILNTLMPPLVVEELRNLPANATAPSHQYHEATIAQSDLCGFTQLASTKTPPQVVAFMDELFGMFDELTDKYGIYKVETVGDAYIAGQAEKPLTKENRPAHVLLFGLDMIDAVHEWSDKLNDLPMSCRVGVHYGRCTGGIVGTDMQRYHLFGSLMTQVDVLEATGKKGWVQLSTPCREKMLQSMKEEGVSGLELIKCTDAELSTSKGEKHDFSEVGGPTYLVKRGLIA